MAASNSSFILTEDTPSCPILLREVMAREQPLTDHGEKLSTIIAVSINLITMPFTVVFNAFVIVSMLKYSSFRKMHLIVLTYLSLTDIFSGLFCQPIYAAKEIYKLLHDEMNCTLESIFYHCSNISLLCSFLHLVLVTYERYVAVLYPFKYPTRITTGRLTCMAVVIWICAIVSTVIHYNYPFSDDELQHGQTIVAILCFILLMFETYCYVRIALVIRKQRRQISMLLPMPNSSQQEQHQHLQQQRQRTRVQQRSSISAGLLIVALWVAYLPFNIFYGLASYYGKMQPPLSYFVPWLEVMVLLNCFYNPIIYCLRTREYKQKFLSILGLSNNEVVPHN